jgi:hypothetical protein
VRTCTVATGCHVGLGQQPVEHRLQVLLADQRVVLVVHRPVRAVRPQHPWPPAQLVGQPPLGVPVAVVGVDVDRTDLAPHRLLLERRERDQCDPLAGRGEPEAAPQRLTGTAGGVRRERVAPAVLARDPYGVEPARVDGVHGQRLRGHGLRRHASTMTDGPATFWRNSDTALRAADEEMSGGCADAGPRPSLT